MNRKKTGSPSRTIVALMVGSMLLAGCSATVTPRRVPLVGETVDNSMRGISLVVRNAEKDDAEHDILTSRGAETGLQASPKAWSRKLVETMALELARRGARVTGSARLELRASLPEITLIQTDDFYQLWVKAKVSSPGWSKKYEAFGEVKASGVWSMSNAADTMAARALSHVVQAMLNDAEFLAQLQAKQKQKR